MVTYTVKAGDTLTHIAQRYNTTVEAIVASNGIKNKNFIYIGQVLKIPGSSAAIETLPAEVKNALDACLAAIENLPEFQRLERLLNG